MPELATFFSVGFLLSLLANIGHCFHLNQSFKKNSILVLQSNLDKVEKFWSQTNHAVSSLAPGESSLHAKEADQFQSLRSAALFGILLTFMSWLGLVFLALYLVSINSFAKSRMEHNIFSSHLVSQKDLSQEDVRQILLSFEASR